MLQEQIKGSSEELSAPGGKKENNDSWRRRAFVIVSQLIQTEKRLSAARYFQEMTAVAFVFNERTLMDFLYLFKKKKETLHF